ncbi:hypothetical protein CP533_6603 [Ophiocordyceps camponoti-saundersi (nom. inval.)]|nr:hypothetical protein CP533_6603 [Ophiocordyceps camponoti-saundersi (nom. inval.)]
MRHAALLTLSGLFVFGSGQSVYINLDENLATLGVDQTGVVSSVEELFYLSAPEETTRVDGDNLTLLGSSWDGIGVDDIMKFKNKEIFASSSSFIRGAIDAWAQHQHLMLRPDEVWFEVLAQLNFYMSSRAEEVRERFVKHSGKEEIMIEVSRGVRAETIINRLSGELQTRVKTRWLADWVKPGFSTSTAMDDVTASVLMMGLMSSYYDYGCRVICGIPSVTLLGTKEDWVALLKKLDLLSEFGEEPSEYASVLRPIFTGFVQSWEHPKSKETKDFWSKIAVGNVPLGCGSMPIVSGWITGFYYWDATGQAVVGLRNGAEVGGIRYRTHEIEDLPLSYAKVPVKLINFPGLSPETKAYLLAGNIGVQRTLMTDGKALATPLSSWYMYTTVEPFRMPEYIFGEVGVINRHIEQCKALPRASSRIRKKKVRFPFHY